MKPAAWDAYLERFHGERPGITSDTLGTARDGGLDPYRWAIEPIPPGDRILDVACGDGPITRRWAGGGWVGIDRSAAELRRAREQQARCVVQGDARQLPVATGSVLALVCSMGLMVLDPIDDVLGEIGRVLAPGGTGVALVPGRRPLTARDLAHYAQLAAALRVTRLRYPNDGALRHLAARAAQCGLRIVDDRRRRFDLRLEDGQAAARFVASLYLPGVGDDRRLAAVWAAAGWVPGTIGIPLRRVTLRRNAGDGHGPRSRRGTAAGC